MHPQVQLSLPYCQYHKLHTYGTNDCIVVKRLIEESLSRKASEKKSQYRRHGQQQYQRDHRAGGRPSGSRGEPPRGPRPQEKLGEQHPPGGETTFPNMKIISGGWSYAGDSARLRKRYTREPFIVGLARGRAEPVSVSISVSETDRRSDVIYPHADPIVVTTVINQYSVSRVVGDSGYQVDFITLGVLKQMKVDLDRLKPVRTPGFLEAEVIHPEGRIELPIWFGTSPFKDILVEFTVVDLNLSYNVILGRPSLNASHSVGEHLKVKFPVGNKGVGEILGDQAEARRCYMNAIKFKAVRVVANLGTVQSTSMSKDPSSLSAEPSLGSAMVPASSLPSRPDSSDFYPRVEGPDVPCLQPVEETIPVQLVPGHPDRVTFIGAGIGESHPELVDFLRLNFDVFAWEGSVSTLESFHIDSASTQKIQQRRRNYNQECLIAMEEEVQKLLRVDVIAEMQYPTWFCNPVMVRMIR